MKDNNKNSTIYLNPFKSKRKHLGLWLWVSGDVKDLWFEKSVDEPCVYKLIKGRSMVFLVIYIDDILLIENDVKVLSEVNA